MFQMKSLHPLIGVEIQGVSLSAPLDEGTFSRIVEAFERHSLLLFRDQAISDAQQLEFSRRFGPLERTKPGTVGEGSELVILTNVAADGAIVPETHRQWLNTRANQLWHSDSSFKPTPALASLLSGREVPVEGGETEFASMRAVWNALPAALQARVDGLVAIHDYAWSRGRIDPELMTDAEREALPPVRQAMVRRHPVTGEASLYAGSHASGVEGMAPEAGRALLSELMEFATRREFVHTHRWRRGDLLVWDNRCTLHRGRPFPASQRRYLVRTTVAGTGPTVGALPENRDADPDFPE
ncbi:MAG: TauD/TfdA family dioxygenase [Betaproteobacteria bacterium]